jgi:hypothetical protein
MGSEVLGDDRSMQEDTNRDGRQEMLHWLVPLLVDDSLCFHFARDTLVVAWYRGEAVFYDSHDSMIPRLTVTRLLFSYILWAPNQNESNNS